MSGRDDHAREAARALVRELMQGIVPIALRTGLTTVDVLDLVIERAADGLASLDRTEAVALIQTAAARHETAEELAEDGLDHREIEEVHAQALACLNRIIHLAQTRPAGRA